MSKQFKGVNLIKEGTYFFKLHIHVQCICLYPLNWFSTDKKYTFSAALNRMLKWAFLITRLLSVRPSACLCACLPILLSDCRSACLPSCLSVCLSVRHSVCLQIVYKLITLGLYWSQKKGSAFFNIQCYFSVLLYRDPNLYLLNSIHWERKRKLGNTPLYINWNIINALIF